MTIRLDTSDRSTVIWCDQCDNWAEVCATRTAALRVAREHERDQHPEQRATRKNYARELARHAP